MPPAGDHGPTFAPGYSRDVLTRACQQIGLDPTGAQLLRHQTNGVYLLPGPAVVVKVSRPDYDVSHIRRTVRLAQWLTGIGFPTVPTTTVDQPVIVDDLAVTFWTYLPQNHPVSAAELAEPLHQLHTLPHPPAGVPAPPELDAISAITFSLDKTTILTPDEHLFLTRRTHSLATALAGLRYQSADCLLHGDPQHGNALHADGRTVLSDWESAATGPAEWDLTTIEIHCRRFGHPAHTYEQFCHRYGRDIRRWDGFPVLREVRELRMITTNARKASAGSPGATEVHHRIVQARHSDSEASWSIL